MRFTDRSRTELDFTCPRARMWAYEHDGKGLAPLEDPEELVFGGNIAEQLARIKAGQDYSTESFSGDAKLLADALLLGYKLFVWPKWLKDFEVVAIEQESPKQLAEWLIYNSRPDTIVRRRSDGTLWYGPEDKTTAWVDSLLHYTNNVQLHATALCIEAGLEGGTQLAGCLVQGLYKGFKKEGRLYHPLAYAYRKDGIPGVTPDQWSTKWVRGWERVSTAEYEPGGLYGWLKFLEKKHPEEISAAFPVSPPVSIRRDLAEAYLKQVHIREGEIEVWRQQGRPKASWPVVFPQNFSMCDEFSRSRKPCSFKPLCWNPTAQRFPMTLYKHRQPHHDNEKQQFENL